MLEIERLIETSEKLIKRLQEGGLDALDEVLNTTRKTAATYRYSYDRYLQYFRDKPAGEILTEQDLYVGFGCAYSWMATIKQLDPRLETIDCAVEALNRVSSMYPENLNIEKIISPDIPKEEIHKLERLIRPIRQFLGSVIGASKLLHFVNPGVFPIWDTTIHRYCDHADMKNTSDSLHRYVHYIYNVHILINNASFNETIYHPLTQALTLAHEAIKDQYKIPEPMGKVRTAEFIMFFGGRLERIPHTSGIFQNNVWEQR
jgi:hypothetical protein